MAFRTHGQDVEMVELPTTAKPLKIVEGDCLEVMRSMPDACIDAVITDPPYGVALQHKLKRTAAGYVPRWRPILNDTSLEWLPSLAREAYRVLAADRYAVVFYGWVHGDQFLSAFRSAGFRPVSHVVWHKSGLGIGYHARSCHESAFVFAKGRPKRGSASFRDVQAFARERKAVHPTQKPRGLMAALVAQYSPADGLVLDPFVGSGSTLLGASDTGRRALGIELDTEYAAAGRLRLNTRSAIPA